MWQSVLIVGPWPLPLKCGISVFRIMFINYSSKICCQQVLHNCNFIMAVDVLDSILWSTDYREDLLPSSGSLLLISKRNSVVNTFCNDLNWAKSGFLIDQIWTLFLQCGWVCLFYNCDFCWDCKQIRRG